MRLECPRCHTSYVDPSPAAEVEPIGCPWCGHTTSAPCPSPFVTTEGLEAARAARAEGVLVVRMRRGPIAELQLLPPDPPELAGLRAAAEHTDAQGMTRRLLATVAHLQELTGRYIEARDHIDPEGERQARVEIERWL